MTAAQFAYAWDAPTGRLLSPNMDHAAAIRSIGFPKGDKDLFTSGLEGKAFRWDLGTGALGEEIALRPAQDSGAAAAAPDRTHFHRRHPGGLGGRRDLGSVRHGHRRQPVRYSPAVEPAGVG